MALGSTVVNFDIALSDVDRGVYETLGLKVAQHPSEVAPYLVARVLAYALEYREGIAFAGGLSTADDPAVWIRDLTGQLQGWIEVGTPDAARLHKASKAVDHVAVYCHKDPAGWLRGLTGERVHDSGKLALYALPPKLIGEVADALDRRNTWSLSRMDGTLYLETARATWEIQVERLDWPA